MRREKRVQGKQGDMGTWGKEGWRVERRKMRKEKRQNMKTQKEGTRKQAEERRQYQEKTQKRRCKREVYKGDKDRKGVETRKGE